MTGRAGTPTARCDGIAGSEVPVLLSADGLPLPLLRGLPVGGPDLAQSAGLARVEVAAVLAADVGAGVPVTAAQRPDHGDHGAHRVLERSHGGLLGEAVVGPPCIDPLAHLLDAAAVLVHRGQDRVGDDGEADLVAGDVGLQEGEDLVDGLEIAAAVPGLGGRGGLGVVGCGGAAFDLERATA
ncbi:hypothetical protein [Streptomyces sp. TLI_105]|uniref:hypothetical protein n=1 Tax=Streptomyces sp. TLI_105 TaxID=1881019 RepID=UPI00115F81A0|nr:hypothetical protein [Streptomyces sp. TLI_105]